MADPKYADLPGIAYDQPDVYETSDLAEADQAVEFYEEENDSIERLHLSATDSYNKFKGKYLNAQDIDFSDKVGRKLRTGYDARSGNWELIADGSKETPIQKYQRLQCELKELIEEVNQLKEAAGNDQNVPKLLDIVSNAEEARRQLFQSDLEQTFGKEIVEKVADPQGVQFKKLLSLLDQYKKGTSDTSGKSSDTSAGEADKLTYILKLNQERSSAEQISRIAKLEQRLHRIETGLGTPSNNLERVAGTISTEAGLLGVAQELGARAGALDSAQLDHIEGRLTALTQKLNEIGQQKQAAVSDPSSDSKISELYDLVKNSEKYIDLLPQTIDRLITLEALHTSAAAFKGDLKQMSSIQEFIRDSNKENKELLEGVRKSLESNKETIKKNITSLNARIDALKK